MKSNRRDLILLAVASALLFGFALGARDLWNPNEPSYGRVVVEMVESGDWLLPRLNGEVFAEKPILSYWLGAVASTLAGGVSESTLRAPLALAGVTSTLLVYLLIAGYASRRTALLGGAVFATQYLVWWTSRTVQMDSFVLLSTLATTLAMTRRLDGDWSARRAWIVAGLSAGLGFAAKGPVTSVVPAAILIAYCVIGRRPILKLFKGLHWGLVIFALTGLPWYAALFASGQTEALRELLLRQNFSRFVEAWDHQQPWYYFLKYFWISYAPWSWFVPISAFVRLANGAEKRARLLGWMWILAPLLFFSLAESKREPYLLPIAPGVALLVALVLDRFVAGTLSPRQRAACLGLFIFFASLFLLGGIYVALLPAHKLPADFSPTILQATLLVCGLVTLGGTAWRSRRWAAPAGLLTALVILFVAASGWILPSGNVLKSHRVFAEEALDLVPPGARLHGFFGPGNRKWQRGGGYAFYMQRMIPHLDSEADALTAWGLPGAICVITEGSLHETELPPLPAARTVLEQEIGSKTSLLICRDAAPSLAAPATPDSGSSS